MDWNLLGENTPVCGADQLRAALGSVSLPVHWHEVIAHMLPAVASQTRSFVAGSLADEHMELMVQ